MVSTLPSEVGDEGKKRKRFNVAQVKGNWQNSDDEKLIRHDLALISREC